MAQQHKSKVHIDIHKLESLIHHLKSLTEELHKQQHHVSLLHHELHYAIKGTTASITNFDKKFDHWMHQLNILTNDIDTAHSILRKVLEEAEEGDLAGIFRALEQGIKLH